MITIMSGWWAEVMGKTVWHSGGFCTLVTKVGGVRRERRNAGPDVTSDVMSMWRGKKPLIEFSCLSRIVLLKINAVSWR
jgi:hypothetical protein